MHSRLALLLLRDSCDSALVVVHFAQVEAMIGLTRDNQQALDERQSHNTRKAQMGAIADDLVARASMPHSSSFGRDNVNQVGDVHQNCTLLALAQANGDVQMAEMLIGPRSEVLLKPHSLSAIQYKDIVHACPKLDVSSQPV
jgi:hypothetical protein